MNRSGYSDDYGWDDLDDMRRANLYRGAVARALNGKRGQALLRRIVEALDAMPVKELAADTFGRPGECACTLGALARHEGLDLSGFEDDDPDPDWGADPVDADIIGNLVGGAESLIREIMYENDTTREFYFYGIGPDLPVDVRLERARKERWRYMRGWCRARINETEKNGE